MALKQIAENSKLFLFDLDGTLYCGEKIFPFTKTLLEEIKNQGKEYKFITNNSSKSPEDYAIKMQTSYGINAQKEDFITSGSATVSFIGENYPDANLYICGTESLKSEFINAGFKVTNDLKAVECLVVGYDTELSFKKIDEVCNILYTKKVPFIATHSDKTCPTAYGFMPDCGAICDMIATTTGKTPIFIGKPAPLMPEICMRMCNIDRTETVVIGDKMSTDILAGLRCDARTILVLSGDNKIDDVLNSTYKPDAVINDCGDLLLALKNGY